MWSIIRSGPWVCVAWRARPINWDERENVWTALDFYTVTDWTGAMRAEVGHAVHHLIFTNATVTLVE